MYTHVLIIFKSKKNNLNNKTLLGNLFRVLSHKRHFFVDIFRILS